MAHRATLVWRSRSPTIVEEWLFIDEGDARLVVLTPRRTRGEVGSYVARPTGAEREALVGAGPETIVFEAWHIPTAPDERALREAADRVTERALASPRSVVGFETRVTDIAADGSVGLALVATAIGSQPISFTLDPGASAVVLADADGRSWSTAMPVPETGFVTADATSVGERGRETRLDPDVTAALTFRIPDAPEATTIAIEVAGTLSEALPDEPEPASFAVRTPEAAIPR